MKSLIACLVILGLTGCATGYEQYADAQVKIAEANALTAKYRYEALAQLGSTGGDAAKVAAVMSMQFGSTQNVSNIQAPKQTAEQALQWTSVLLPSLTQMYSINATKTTSLAQIDASTAVQTHQQDAFVKFGTLINTPTVVNQPTPIVVKPEVVNPVVIKQDTLVVR